MGTNNFLGKYVLLKKLSMNISPNTKHSIYLAVILVGVVAVAYTVFTALRLSPKESYEHTLSSDKDTSSALVAEYESVHLYETGTSTGKTGLHFIQITGGVTPEVQNAINAQIRKGVPGCTIASYDEEARNGIQERYLNELSINDHKSSRTDEMLTVSESEVRGWGAEEAWQYLVQDFRYSQWASTTAVFNSKGILSLMTQRWIFCAGAYPDFTMGGMVFDLSTGEEITFPKLFQEYEKNKRDIGHTLATYVVEGQKREGLWSERCDLLSDIEEGSLDIDYIAFTLDAEGISLESVGHPHISQACEPGTHVPYSVLERYLSSDLFVGIYGVPI